MPAGKGAGGAVMLAYFSRVGENYYTGGSRRLTLGQQHLRLADRELVYLRQMSGRR